MNDFMFAMGVVFLISLSVAATILVGRFALWLTTVKDDLKELERWKHHYPDNFMWRGNFDHFFMNYTTVNASARLKILEDAAKRRKAT